MNFMANKAESDVPLANGNTMEENYKKQSSQHESPIASSTLTSENGVLYKDSKDEDAGNKKKKLKFTSTTPSSVEFDSSDSDDDSFGNLTLGFCAEENTAGLMKVASGPQTTGTTKKFISKQDTVGHNNKPKLFNKPKQLIRSLSAQNLNEAKIQEIICKNCLRNQLADGDTQTLVELKGEIMIVSEKLKKKIKECITLTYENQKLKHSLAGDSDNQKSLLSKFVWGHSPGKKMITAPKNVNNFDLNILAEEIKMLNQEIVVRDKQLQEKDKEIRKHLERISTQKQHLKQTYFKKTEAQKAILDEMDETCKNMEAKLNVERKLREKREAEVAHIYNSLDRTEKYYQKQIEEKEERIKCLEGNHNQEIEILAKIIKQKDEELTQINQNYNLILDKCNQRVEAINLNFQEQPLDEVLSLEEIKISNLQQSLQLKTMQLNDAYLEINKIQKELNVKQQELANLFSELENSRKQDTLKKQLENIKQQIHEIVNVIEQGNSSYIINNNALL